MKTYFLLTLLVFGFIGLTSRDAWNRNNEDPYSEKRREIVEIARTYIGTPYKAGGSDPRGFDCSGLTMYVYKQAGIRLPRTTTDQYFTLQPVKRPREGDLVFFRLESRDVSHVGIYIGNFQFIHAPSSGKKVEIADLRNPYWKKSYAGSRSYFDGVY